jgi:hypothetical protein
VLREEGLETIENVKRVRTMRDDCGDEKEELREEKKSGTLVV